jgi:ribosomal protein L40E
MANFITKCRKCGSTTFFLHESELWSASVDDDGRLACTNPDNAIDAIDCAQCGAEHTPDDFADIDFN